MGGTGLWPGRCSWEGLTLLALAFHSALGNMLISWGRVSEVRGMRFGIFIWGKSLPEVQLSLCSAGLLSLPRSPNCADACDPPSLAHRYTHPFLAAGATNYSSAPPQAAQGPERWSCRTQGSAWTLGCLVATAAARPPFLILFPISRGGVERLPHRPLLCH